MFIVFLLTSGGLGRAILSEFLNGNGEGDVLIVDKLTI